MTQPEGKSKKRTTQDVEALRSRLADRDRELAALTEHSLRILDQLAALRQQTTDATQVHDRIGRLEAALADARQRVRSSSLAYLGPRETSADSAFDVVLWGLATEPGVELEKAITSLDGCSVTAMMGQGHSVEAFRFAAEHGCAVLETSCSRPAHFWNQAMASTQADVVVFVAGDVSLGAEDVRRLAAAARANGVSVACPVVQTAGASVCGRVEQGVLDLRPLHLTEVSESKTVQFASTEAFAIAREVFQAVGMFDQDLATDLALAEWTMRATARSLRVVAVAEAVCSASVLRTGGGAVAEADRLVVLARHRPHQLMTAALSSESLWQLDSDMLGAALRAAIQRLPRASEMPTAVDLLAHQAQTMAGWKRIAPALRERVASLCRELQIQVDAQVVDAGLPPLVDRIATAVNALRQRAASADSAQLAAQKSQQELDRLSKDRGEVERQLKDGMLARSGTIDALRNELLERERAIASLRQELGHKQGETQRFVDHLAQQQEQILDLKEQLARVVAESEARRGVEERLWTAQEELVSLRARSEADRNGDEIRLKTQAVELRAQQEAYRSQSMDLGAAEQELVLLRAQVAEAAEARRRADDTIAALGKGAEAQQERIDLWKARCTELESALDEQGSREALRTQEDEARIRTLASQLEAAERSAKSEAAAFREQLEAAELSAKSAAAAFKERIRVAEVRTEEAEAATHAAAARALGLEARIRSADSRLAAIEGEQAETNAIAAQQRLLAEAHAQKAEARAQELEAKLAETESARARLEDELEERGAKNAHAERQNRELTRVVETMRSELQGTREEAVSLRKQFGVATSRAEDSARVVQERELWICLLLEEVRQRRVLPREFAPHEVEFLNRHGKTTKS